MPRAKRRRTHTAKAWMQVMDLSKAGTAINVELFADQEKIGTLVIGRGSLTWYGKKWKQGRWFPWPRFAEFMER